MPMPYSALSHLDCPRCGTRYDADRVQGTCSCGSPLLARYDLGQVARKASPRDIAGRPADLWRYHELLPVRQAAQVVSLGEGMTPLLAMPTIGQALGVPDLLMKDEGLLPTGTFKARGAAVGVSRAAELGVAAIAMPTNGNAGAAWSVYAARAGMRSLIVMPVAAPQITRAECAAAGIALYREHRGDPQPLVVHHGSLLDVELDVGRQARSAAPGLERAIEIDPIGGQHVLEPVAVAIAQIASRLDVKPPGERGTTEQAASEAGAFLVGPVDECERTERAGSVTSPPMQNAERRHHAERTVEPAARRHRVQVGAHRQGRLVLALQPGPHVPGFVALGLDPDLGEQLAEKRAGLVPRLRPGDAASAGWTAGAAVELAQLGDDPGSVDSGADRSPHRRNEPNRCDS